MGPFSNQDVMDKYFKDKYRLWHHRNSGSASQFSASKEQNKDFYNCI